MWLTTYGNKPVDRIFSELFDTRSAESNFSGISVYDKDDKLHVRADLPGLKKEEIRLEIKKGYLTISADRKVEIEKDAKVFAWGSSEYHFARSVKLPYAVDEDAVDAKYEDGVLTITLPRTEESKPKAIEIN